MGADSVLPNQGQETLLLTEEYVGMMHPRVRSSVQLILQDQPAVSHSQIQEWFRTLDTHNINEANKPQRILIAKTYQQIYEALGNAERDVRSQANAVLVKELDNTLRTKREYQNFQGYADIIEQFDRLEDYQKKALVRGSEEAFGINMFAPEHKDVRNNVQGTLMWLDSVKDTTEHVRQEYMTIRTVYPDVVGALRSR